MFTYAAKNPSKVMPVRVTDILMDEYQRKLNPSKVKAIYETYDENRDRPIELSQRNGKYYCFDGQHRLEVHKMRKDEYVLAQVHFGLTYQDEARLFAEQHKNEQMVSAADRWSAAMKAGRKSPEVYDINRICNAHGYTINVDKSKSGSKTFHCVQELQDIYAKHGRNGLVTLLAVLLGAWDGRESATHREIVGGIKKIMDVYGKQMGDAEWNRLARVLSKTTPRQLLMDAHSVVGRGAKQTAKIMVDKYNLRLRRDDSRLNPYLIR